MPQATLNCYSKLSSATFVWMGLGLSKCSSDMWSSHGTNPAFRLVSSPSWILPWPCISSPEAGKRYTQDSRSSDTAATPNVSRCSTSRWAREVIPQRERNLVFLLRESNTSQSATGAVSVLTRSSSFEGLSTWHLHPDRSS